MRERASHWISGATRYRAATRCTSWRRKLEARSASRSAPGEHDQDPSVRGILKVRGQAAPGAGELDASPLPVALHLAVGDDQNQRAVARRGGRGVDGVENLGERGVFRGRLGFAGDRGQRLGLEGRESEAPVHRRQPAGGIVLVDLVEGIRGRLLLGGMQALDHDVGAMRTRLRPPTSDHIDRPGARTGRARPNPWPRAASMEASTWAQAPDLPSGQVQEI